MMMRMWVNQVTLSRQGSSGGLFGDSSSGDSHGARIQLLNEEDTSWMDSLRMSFDVVDNL
jgi:hypothetical protein